MKVVVPPEVEVKNQRIHGIPITIPALVIDKEERGRILAMFAAAGRTPLITVQSMHEDSNSYDILWQPFGLYNCTMLALAVFSAALSGYILKNTVDLTREHSAKSKHSRAKTMAFVMRMLILTPEFIGAVVAVFVCLDPVGAFYSIDYYTARSLLNSRCSLFSFTSSLLTPHTPPAATCLLL